MTHFANAAARRWPTAPRIGAWLPVVAVLSCAPLLAQQPVLGGNKCLIESRNLQVHVQQLPAISIPGISPADILAISVAGIPIAVSGATSRITVDHATGCPNNSSMAIPTHIWKLDVPAGSHSTISESPGLQLRFTPDIVGNYTIHLTACPTPVGNAKNPCEAKVVTDIGPNGQPIMDTVTVGPAEANLSFAVKGGMAIPPLFRPGDHPVAPGLQPTSPQTYQTAVGLCPDGPNIVLGSPEWLTTTTFTGPTPPYELIEGRAYVSDIAGQDTPFNHVSNDVITKVDVDPPFRRILINTAEDLGPLLPFGGIEVEWEDGIYPDGFRAVPGNRVSFLGYHVVDCGHEPHTEIHPPIAVAVHRQMPIHLPPTVAYMQGSDRLLAVGPNVYVPGILTDVLVNLNGGVLLDAGNSRGTHQPLLVKPPDSRGIGTFPKVNQPTTAGVKFDFRVFLPPNPSFVIQQYGLTPAFKPALYWKEYASPLLPAPSGLNLTLEEQQLDGPTPYLRFSADLSALKTGDRVGRRIEAAWVYPDISGANWGLQNLSIRLQELTVTDTGDFTSGDWRLWMNESGSLTPWTKLIDCNGCIEQKTYTPSSNIWQPNAFAAPDGTLPGTIARFQTAPADYFQLTGYDKDALYSDGIPEVFLPIVSAQNSVTASAGCSDCPSYSLKYSTTLAMNPGALTQTAIDAFKALLVHPAILQLVHPPPETELFAYGTASAQRTAILSQKENDMAELMGDFSGSKLGATLHSYGADPFAQLVRKRALSQYGKNPTDASRRKLLFRLRQIKPSLPAATYQKYLCDLETGKPCVKP